MKKLFLLSLVLINCQLFSQSGLDIPKDSLVRKLKDLEYSIDQIQRDRINYQIEKDLLKETYSKNFETINLLITLILGVIGVFAFFGLRDINTIKKEYSKELEDLRETKRDFDTKAKEFDKDKGKFEEEIKQIIKTNESQNNKIKTLELKEKIQKLLEENKVYEALEYVNTALELSPNDSSLHTSHGIIFTRLNQIDKAQYSFEKALSLDPDFFSWISNLIEFYSLTNNFAKANELITSKKAVYESSTNEGLRMVKNIFELFHKGDETELIEYIKTLIDKTDLESQKGRVLNWRLTEAKYIAAYQPDGSLKDKLQNILWYLDGQISGNTIIKRLGIQI